MLKLGIPRRGGRKYIGSYDKGQDAEQKRV